MKFFKPEDFPYESMGSLYGVQCNAAHIANEKIQREGKIFYGCIAPAENKFHWAESQISLDTHKALFICVEKIERCTHPSEKVSSELECIGGMEHLTIVHKCECGAKVKPSSFEAV